MTPLVDIPFVLIPPFSVVNFPFSFEIPMKEIKTLREKACYQIYLVSFLHVLLINPNSIYNCENWLVKILNIKSFLIEVAIQHYLLLIIISLLSFIY